MKSDSVPFFYNENLSVNFILDHTRLENLELKVEYREDSPAPIIGYFKCGKEKNKEFNTFANEGRFFRIESVSKGNTLYFSDTATIIDIANDPAKSFFEGTIEMFNFYSKIDFLSGKKDFKLFDHNERAYKPIDTKRYLEFQLVGPSEIWGRSYIHEIMKSDISFISKVKDMNKFAIDNFQCSYYTKEIRFKTNSEVEHYEITKKRVFFRIEEIIDSDRNDDDFKTSIIDFFEGILLLISFASSSNISWLVYNFNGDLHNIWYLKSFLNSEKFINDRPWLVIETHYLNAFLINSHKNFKELEDKINLIYPIREYLSNNFAIYGEQQFLIVYIAFEKLVNDVCKMIFDDELILEKSKFKKTRKLIEEFLNNKNTDLSNKELEKINEKLNELNRTSIAGRIKNLLAHFDIPFQNGLDENGDFKFLKIRNKYIHSSRGQQNDYDLINENERLKKYFELIVLKLLDNDSLSHLHPDFKFMWERSLIKINKEKNGS